MKSLLLFSALAVAGVLVLQSAEAASLDAEYRVRLRGFPIGVAGLKVESDGREYSLAATMRTGGLIRIVTAAAASGEASGRVDGDRLVPTRYGHDWKEDGDDEVVSMRFRDGRAADVSIDPPPRPRLRAIPVTEEHRTGVLDPLSALVFPGDMSDPAALCDRTLPVFDGRQRYDLTLSFTRTERLGPDQGWSTPGEAVVCSIRYRAVAGHRPGRESVRFMEKNKDMEVWMAPVGDSGLVAPVQSRFRTRAGVIQLDGRRFAVSP